MPLPGYGLLIGSIVDSRPQQGGSPHWLLMVQPAERSHPPYRVAVNLQSSVPTSQPEVQYQCIDIRAAGTSALKNLSQRLSRNGGTPNFVRAADNPNSPALDFIHGGIIDPAAFIDIPPGADPFRDAFVAALRAAGQDKHLIAVFGTGYPNDPQTGKAQPTGYEGVDNIHMNQGSFRATGGTRHYLENGPRQDGGLIFLLPSGPLALFMKFHSQSISTDGNGNPQNTGIAQLDRIAAPVRHALIDAPLKAVKDARRTSPVAAAAAAPQPVNGAGFVFADENPQDATAEFVPDDDQTTFKSPLVMQYSRGTTRGPVPKPRRYPTLALNDVVGDAPPGYTKSAAGEQIAFDMVGDSGATTQSKLKGELQVTELMASNARKAASAFLFHVGDLVYFYGEEPYYYSQFYEPFRAYPAPIFAIPGNHDAIIANANEKSLETFEAAFCAEAPGRWQGSGGVLRSTMIQPGVYFTLDAPLVSIVGLYSNCSESIGWIDEQQTLFLYQELQRLKALRQSETRAVILAVHHCPRWFGGSATDLMTTAIDSACNKADFWPDAVICGHAHLYQRIVRQAGGRDIPYLIAGAGGYGVNPQQVLAKGFTATLPAKMNKLLLQEGYLRVTISKPAAATSPAMAKFEYFSTKAPAEQPSDVCEINLNTHQMVTP